MIKKLIDIRLKIVDIVFKKIFLLVLYSVLLLEIYAIASAVAPIIHAQEEKTRQNT